MTIEIIEHWNEKLLLFPAEKRDIYFTEDYLKIAANGMQQPVCVYCEENGKILLFPFLRQVYNSFYDFETPYGYGGPISNTDDNSWNEKALKQIILFLYNLNYLVGFIRFHPLLKNADFCRNVLTVIDDRNTIVINTNYSIDDIWNNQISSKNRNMIRKAEKNGLSFIRDNEFNYLNEFKKLYNTTMQRLSADKFYFFGDSYYDEFIKSFAGKGFLGCIRKQDLIISAALFMYDDYYGHYHLAGSDGEFSSLGSNNLLLWKAACEMHNAGVREFHLGGGTNADSDNSLYKFKKSFSNNIKQFSIGKIIFNKTAYEKICKEWEEKNPEKANLYKNYLLKYRC